MESSFPSQVTAGEIGTWILIFGGVAGLILTVVALINALRKLLEPKPVKEMPATQGELGELRGSLSAYATKEELAGLRHSVQSLEANFNQQMMRLERLIVLFEIQFPVAKSLASLPTNSATGS